MLALTLAKLMLTSLAGAVPVDQDSHTKVLFNSLAYTVSPYLRSTYIRANGTVEFSMCGREKIPDGQFHSCDKLATVPFSRLKEIEAPLLEALRQFRDDKAKKADESFFSFFSGGAKKDGNVQAANQLIAAIERNGIESWVQIQREQEPEPAYFSSFEAGEEVAEIIRRHLTGENGLPLECRP